MFMDEIDDVRVVLMDRKGFQKVLTGRDEAYALESRAWCMDQPYWLSEIGPGLMRPDAIVTRLLFLPDVPMADGTVVFREQMPQTEAEKVWHEPS